MYDIVIYINNNIPVNIIFYSCTHKSSQWYHPEYVQLVQQVIQKFRHTRYTAYRTAQKLALLRDTLNGGFVLLTESMMIYIT